MGAYTAPGVRAVSEPEELASNGTAAAYLNLIAQQLSLFEEELEDGELLRIVVCTPEGRMEALQRECVDPNLPSFAGSASPASSRSTAPIRRARRCWWRYPARA
jgi:hypothetical protein